MDICCVLIYVCYYFGDFLYNMYSRLKEESFVNCCYFCRFKREDLWVCYEIDFLFIFYL